MTVEQMVLGALIAVVISVGLTAGIMKVWDYSGQLRWWWEMRQRSKTRVREDQRRAKLLRDLGQVRGPWCEAQLEGCGGHAVDGHEILARSAGGSITDPDNILLLCRSCHRWVTEHPAEATELGLRRSRYGGDVVRRPERWT